MTINPMETRYAGCRFRSRLEARWAVFFDKLGIRWEYEPQGYVVNGRPYLPDFLLPDLRAVVEVKGDPARLDIPLLAETAAYTHDWEFTLILGPVPTADVLKVPIHSCLTTVFDVRPSKRTVAVINDFGRAMETIEDPDVRAAIDAMVKTEQTAITIVMTQVAFMMSGGTAFLLPVCLPVLLSPEKTLNPGTVWPILPSPKVEKAYEAARSARFEHGEMP